MSNCEVSTLDRLTGFLQPGRRTHLIGIGGVSMCALADVLHGRGLLVTGSDMQNSPALTRLRDKGIHVTVGHREETFPKTDCVIRTAAVHDDNPEVLEARRQGVPVFERSEAWGVLMRSYATALCVAGTHGKTTVASMATHLAMEGGLDPTVMIGGTLPLIGAGHRVGTSDLIIMEACEYCNSFLNFSPTIAIILNIEADHLDFFADLDDIVHSFRQFALRTPPQNGLVLLCADDAGAMRLHGTLDRPTRTFGLSREADVSVQGLRFERGYASFTVVVGGKPYAPVALRVPGAHNVTNALAAAAAAHHMGLPAQAVTGGLLSFHGAGRRFQKLGSFNGADVVDDYAHHPTEIAATLSAARAMGYERILCVFQPHTYSRTNALFHEFTAALRGADRVFLSEIYAAREKNQTGLSAEMLLKNLPGAVFYSRMEDIAQAVAAEARPGDLVLTMGAGNIDSVGVALASAEPHSDNYQN